MAFISIPTSIGGINIPGKLGKIASGPLALLFFGKGVTTKKYPLDLGTDAAKLHYVQFSVREIIPASVGEVSGSKPGTSVSLGGLGKIVNVTGDAMTTLTNEISNKISPKFSNHNSTTAFDTTLTNKSTNIIGDFLTKGVTISPRLSELKSVISLYMPDTIYAEYSSEYSEFNLMDEGGLIAGIRAVNQIADKNSLDDIQTDSLGSAFKSIGKMAGNIAGTQPETIYLASKVLGMENIGAILNKARGYAINPQVQMIYKGIDLRSFQLTFTFTPKSAQEAKEIDDIIALFKHHYAPRLESGTETSVNSMFFIPPSMFTVQFMHDGRENIHLPKYGECVLSNITVDYAPNGFAAYEDGSPVQSQLMLQFKETEIIDRNKLEKGDLR
jgi:hypothetical protein